MHVDACQETETETDHAVSDRPTDIGRMRAESVIEFMAVVPELVQSDGTMEVTTPHNQTLKIKLPEGLAPGNTFKVQLLQTTVSASQNIEAAVAAGEAPEQIVYTTDGQQVRVVVPEGLPVGSAFQVRMRSECEANARIVRCQSIIVAVEPLAVCHTMFT